MKLDHKKLAAKYWNMLHPYVNFYSLKEKQIHDQYNTMEKFLQTIKEMEELTDHKAPADRRSGFYDGRGELVSEGDRVVYTINGQKGTLVEALQDGDAQVTWDSGKHSMVKWNNLIKI